MNTLHNDAILQVESHDMMVDFNDDVFEQQHQHQEEEDGALVLLIVVGIAIAAQMLLRCWQLHSPRMFHLVSFAGLWLLPIIFSVLALFVRFILVWLLYSITTMYLLAQTRAHGTMRKELPSFIYFWFSAVHKLCYATASAGFACIVLGLLGGLNLFALGFMMCYYGLYFGVLCRDSAQMACERLVARLGYYNDEYSMPSRALNADICCLCDSRLGDNHAMILRLECGHRYHSACLKGWAMVGKKDTCAYCREKIDLRNVLKNSAWKSPSILWGQLLDALRMMIVWNPIILIVMNIILSFVGFNHREHFHAMRRSNDATMSTDSITATEINGVNE